MKRSPFFLLLFVVFQTALFSAQASPLGDSPRHVPLDEYIRPAATDLIYNGKLLFPAEATQLKKQGTDISQLNPAESDIYKNQTTLQSDNLNIQSGARVKYLEVIASPLKFYRFNVQDRSTGEMHTILLGKRAQTLLLRKAMLRRLGYQIPAMKRLARLTVEFSSSIAKADFIENRGTGLQMNADGDKEWILNLDDKNSNVIEFQDVIALSPTPAITNVAEGFLEPLIKGRRAINGLILPYNLVDVTSVEGLRWCSNPVRQNAINFPLYDNEAFSTSIDDLRWMMRKVSRLTRQDFVEIVKEAQFPYPSDLLMVEKLIARRNCARRIIKTEGQDLPFNPQVSAPPHLVDGQLLKEEFEGFAARYAMGEEESPVAPKEIFSLFESKVIGTAIDKLVSKINSDILPFTSPAQIGMNKQQDELLKDLLSFIKTGKPRSRDFGIWATPFLQGNLIASREVVAGSYMGTDNRISLVDTFGFAVETGLTGGALGLSPSKLLTGQASMSYLKQFAHVRQLDSVKNSLKEPYRNIIVPLVKKDIAKVIPTGLAAQFEKLDYEAQVTKAKEIVEVFKSELHDGESIIITESFGPSLGVFAGIDLGKEILFEKRLVAQAAIRAQQQTISRLHLLRIGDKIHVYKDRGNIKSLSFIVALQANIEVLNIRAKFTKGTASTAFYHASIDPNLDANPDLVLNLAAIRDVLMKSIISKL
ncbi:MAG: hypothetical protein AABZ31_00120, partial [Bdellovibrionota bacterium]